MSILNSIVSYWYECIKNEDVLEKDISINVRTRAILYPFDSDPFIFRKVQNKVIIDDKKIAQYLSGQNEGLEYYYGYPLLYYRDPKDNRELVAPLFIIKIRTEQEDTNLLLTKDESYPVCGIQALTKLGLRSEEIAQINELIEGMFMHYPNLQEQQLADLSIKIVQTETEVAINEPISPHNLTNSQKISKDMSAGLYNKSIIFSGETTAFNIHLIQDLIDLKDKDNLGSTAMSFFDFSNSNTESNKIVPILPFPSNEYQITALQEIFSNSLSVITGPPGTGKSQFISNLIINLFLADKSVLFVSHTGEAVDVVNSKINDQFRNLMFRTGKKALRQELKGKFNELIAESSKRRTNGVGKEYIVSLWATILEFRDGLVRRDGLEQEYERNFQYQKNLNDLLRINDRSFIGKIILLFKIYICKFKSLNTLSKLKSLPQRDQIERKIRQLESEYYVTCQDYVRDIYLGNIIGNVTKTGAVNAFLNNIHNHRYNEESANPLLFTNALSVLKIWSSTLKSLRGTFPLKPGLFDYVVFDEASQIDLPSAAPALYRAKRAIVVGDPMQLTHIAGITKEIDFTIAKSIGLSEIKDVYPHRVRYCDVSLYKAAENSIDHSPILLTNHYRSEDQIIALCNEVFYEGRLKIFSTLDYKMYPNKLPLGINWVDIKGESVKYPGGSRVNLQEVDGVVNTLKNVLNEIKGTNLTVGIVTPYSAQRRELNDKVIANIDPEEIAKHKIKILTAHQFQGSEKDIVIFSLVVASKGNGNSDRWYNIYPQILNVALSRARYLLYVIGDMGFCKNREGILGKIESIYGKIKIEEKYEEHTLKAKFDSPTERSLYEELMKYDLDQYGYKLIPKMVVKRYTLDFALIGNKKINIEVDGIQHEMVGGMPVIEDVERDDYLTNKEGWNVIRIPNYRVLNNIADVMADILQIVQDPQQ